jgi:serine/threonine protein kinase
MLADFGLACEKHGEFIKVDLLCCCGYQIITTKCGWDGVKTHSNLAGTPRYMAPEAYRDELCTEKIDIYSFAMLTWEKLTGQVGVSGNPFCL